MILTLPDDVMTFVLCNWFGEIANLTVLDSAICSKKERQLFLNLLKRDFFVFDNRTASNSLIKSIMDKLTSSKINSS